MKLKELLSILPEGLDISVQHNECKTNSSVKGIMACAKLIESEVIYAEPNFVESIGIQSFNVKVR
jgi:hypothetical protein